MGVGGGGAQFNSQEPKNNYIIKIKCTKRPEINACIHATYGRL